MHFFSLKKGNTMSIILVSITQTFFHVLSKRSILCRNTRGWHYLDVSGSKDTPPSTRFIWVIWVGRWTFVVGLADQTWKHTFKRNPADGAAMLHGAVTWRFWKAKLCQQLAILCYPMNIYIYIILYESYPKKTRNLLSSANSQAEYEDLDGIQGAAWCNIREWL